ncbi:RluA family pseudouridine synthase [Exiguobacterium flavidum]|uniref:RluA family pseudouridine synthase n=1 Tax=Exiguobacterium flavidum TaxID=2184695 RepID=UPI000DF81389|nr:RluA family pseudouridine synthase [Exiguobacterium flavidum]
MKSFQLKRRVASRECGITVSHFCTAVIGVSRKMLTSIKHHGDILLNGKHVNVYEEVKEGDEVHLIFPLEAPAEDMMVTEGPVDIVYEDDWLLVVNKPPGMASIPSRLHPDNSLANYVLGYYRSKGIPYAIHIVNRLDRDTSGLVVFAKHAFCHHLMSRKQKNGKIDRNYIALIEGQVAPQTIDAPIGRAEGSFIERCVTEEGQHAVTHLLEVEPFTAAGHELSLLRIKLETGRTHQIRVHLAYIGHPLVGDTLYGGRPILSRQALHSAVARFDHPGTGEPCVFEAALPEDMRSHSLIMG